MRSIAGNNAQCLTVTPLRNKASAHTTAGCAPASLGKQLQGWTDDVMLPLLCLQPWLSNPLPSSGAAVATQTPGKQSETRWKLPLTKWHFPSSVPRTVPLQRQGLNCAGKRQRGRYRTALAPANLDLLPNYISNMKLHKSVSVTPKIFLSLTFSATQSHFAIMNSLAPLQSWSSSLVQLGFCSASREQNQHVGHSAEHQRRK